MPEYQVEIEVLKKGIFRFKAGNDVHPFVLKKDGREYGQRFRTYNDALIHLHKIQPHSWDYAMKYGGWEIVNEKETL